MIDAIGLRFLKDLTYGMVQSDRGSQVVPKGLFNNRAAPCTVIFLYETGRAEMLDDNREKFRADREIEEAVPFRPFVLLDLIEGTLEFGVEIGVAKIAGQVVHAIHQPSPGVLINRARRELAHVLRGPLAELLRRVGLDRDPNDGELVGQELALSEIVDRRNQHAFGEITRGAKNHHGARSGGCALAILQVARSVEGVHR